MLTLIFFIYFIHKSKTSTNLTRHKNNLLFGILLSFLSLFFSFYHLSGWVDGRMGVRKRVESGTSNSLHTLRDFQYRGTSKRDPRVKELVKETNRNRSYVKKLKILMVIDKQKRIDQISLNLMKLKGNTSQWCHCVSVSPNYLLNKDHDYYILWLCLNLSRFTKSTVCPLEGQVPSVF